MPLAPQDLPLPANTAVATPTPTAATAPDPSLANTMVPATAAPNPTQPGTPEHQALFNGWLDYLSHPEVQTALLQFGASMLQPAGWGQSSLGQLGQAVGEAGQAVGRYRKGEADAAAQAAELEAKKAQTLNEAERTKIAQQEATQTGAYQQGQLGLTKEQQAEQARHDVAAEGLQKLQIGADQANSASLRQLQIDQLNFSKQQEANRQAEEKIKLGIEQQQADTQKEYYRTRMATQQNLGQTKLNVRQTVLLSQMNAALGKEDDWLFNHPEATADDYAAAQEEWYRKIDAAGGTPAATGDTTQPPPPATTTAPAATVPATTPTTPTAPATGGAGIMDTIRANQAPVGPVKPEEPARQPRIIDPTTVKKQKDGSLAMPDGNTWMPFSQLTPEEYASKIHLMSADEIANLWDVYEKAGGVTKKQQVEFLNKVGDVLRKQGERSPVLPVPQQ